MNSVKKEYIIIALLIVLLLSNVAIWGYLYAGMEKTNSEYLKLNDKINTLRDDMDVLKMNMNAIDYTLLSDKVEEICIGKDSEEEKVIAIWQWICANISNREYKFENNMINDTFGWYATRSGLCAARSHIMCTMVEILNLKTHIMNLYDFPTPQSGHTCVEVYYGDEWHFFDPTYGGYFRNVEGKIMSLEEMHQNPEEAIAGMVIFADNLDYVDNYVRTTYNFSVENLRILRSYGIKSRENTVIVYPMIDFDQITNLQIGLLDQSWEDVLQDGRESNLSGYLYYGLGQPSDVDIQTMWEFRNCEEKKYYIEYYYYNYNGNSSEYNVVTENAEIVAGESLRIEQDVDENGVYGESNLFL